MNTKSNTAMINSEENIADGDWLDALPEVNL